MTREQLEAEMVEGYFDGLDLSSPEPSANRSHSYRHGFVNGRADSNGKCAWPSVQFAEAKAEASIAADLDS